MHAFIEQFLEFICGRSPTTPQSLPTTSNVRIAYNSGQQNAAVGPQLHCMVAMPSHTQRMLPAPPPPVTALPPRPPQAPSSNTTNEHQEENPSERHPLAIQDGMLGVQISDEEMQAIDDVARIEASMRDALLNKKNYTRPPQPCIRL